MCIVLTLISGKKNTTETKQQCCLTSLSAGVLVNPFATARPNPVLFFLEISLLILAAAVQAPLQKWLQDFSISKFQ